jgi:phosphate starvation-inducible protein PhoH and related proteins
LATFDAESASQQGRRSASALSRAAEQVLAAAPSGRSSGLSASAAVEGRRIDPDVPGRGRRTDPAEVAARGRRFPIDGSAQRSMQIDGVAMVRLLGPQDRLLTQIEKQFPLIDVLVRGNEITLDGEPAQVQAAERLIEELLQMVRNGHDLGPADVRTSAQILGDDATSSPAELLSQAILVARGKSIRPKTLGQKAYVEAIEQNTITFGIGPAGTGKTYLAMAKAIQALQRKQVSRIILTRPAVEAGERLGYLPGTLTDKIDPYLRPLYDALNEMMDPELVPKLMASSTIEVAPLAYMRGRTLNDSFVVLDEAQNTTPEQMKMFLTRLGFNSKMVITGDITQVDLPAGISGLRTVTRVLQNVDDIHFSMLGSEDVVRHTLVGKIVDAYTRFDEQRLAAEAARRGDRGDSVHRMDTQAVRVPTDFKPPQNRSERRAQERAAEQSEAGRHR